MKHKLVAALLATALLAVEVAVGVDMISPVSAQTDPKVLGNPVSRLGKS